MHRGLAFQFISLSIGFLNFCIWEEGWGLCFYSCRNYLTLFDIKYTQVLFLSLCMCIYIHIQHIS